MVRTLPIGFDEALALTLEHIHALPPESTELLDSFGRALAEDIFAKVDSPSIDASLKDGYAVISEEVAHASAGHPVALKLAGSIGAGDPVMTRVTPGFTVRVLTGARIPPDANAVLSEEFTECDGSMVIASNNAEPGRNILPKGSDVANGQLMAKKGSLVVPGVAGLMAAAGYSQLNVVRSPTVALISTGSEVVAPGKPLPEGKLYASNMTTLGSWCRKYGMQPLLSVVEDDPHEISKVIQSYSASADAIVTSGGAWTSDRDLVARILDELGWKQIFHRIRIGPGKAVGFGILNDKPVFILPGGPPSNLMGFLQIALPGLLTLAGHGCPHLPMVHVKLAEEIRGRHADWTQFVFGVLTPGEDAPVFHALTDKSRLRSMAEAHAVVSIPEGKTLLPAGITVTAQHIE
ncbi:MoeA domain protein domain I and II [Desulfosarcina cetonica]|uniref:molybdopterin molybdotransferase MoeA n=1 Tax=Desulfosarcina cetonica TaxID=90730 RepID=UPI0006D060A6|nr:gephyrin-like molybdotransferase Glp [Desulfosarcina cetonica]VTR70407.1 MoeA domain protein domain I and II [Desulfosarcina cetonica]